MAKRRMFANDILESGAFLEMPATTQMLYIHLNMHADDDGFISNPKQIMKMVDATIEDLEMLLSRRFLLSFDSGIVVIKHWLINNNIRNDRRKDTVYTVEKSQLFVKDNKAYTFDSSKGANTMNCIDNQVTTKCHPSIGKVSKGKRQSKVNWLDELRDDLEQQEDLKCQREKERQKELMKKYFGGN